MEQRCYFGCFGLTWLGFASCSPLLVGLESGAVRRCSAFGVIGQIVHRWFPSISRWVGYGSVAGCPVTSALRRRGPPHVVSSIPRTCARSADREAGVD